MNVMKITKAYKFRIYPDTKREVEIDNMLILAQQFYNKLLEKSIQSYKDRNDKISMLQFNKFTKEAITENNGFLALYSQTRCEIEYRVIKAYRDFFCRVNEKKAGKKVKVEFPRFKSRARYDSITYPQDNGSFLIEPNHKRKGAYIRVSRIGSMKIEEHRKIEGKIKTMTIKREGENCHYIPTGNANSLEELRTYPAIAGKPTPLEMGRCHMSNIMLNTK